LVVIVFETVLKMKAAFLNSNVARSRWVKVEEVEPVTPHHCLDPLPGMRDAHALEPPVGAAVEFVEDRLSVGATVNSNDKMYLWPVIAPGCWIMRLVDTRMHDGSA
jgi:hypothetical protein